MSTPESAPRYLNVRQLAAYLQINEKKVYALVAEGVIPGTKATGKWLFPRELIDRWLLETSHGGALTDRLIVSGAEDPLLRGVADACAAVLQARAMLCYSPTDTRLGLALLDRGRADAAVVHWGPAGEASRRHPALLQHYTHHGEWVLVHLFRREQGLLLASGAAAPGEARAVFAGQHRWALRAASSGTQRFFQETAAACGADPDALRVAVRAVSGRAAAASLQHGKADAAPGCRGLASEHGLGFASAGWEDVELVVSRGNYFRALVQELLQQLKQPLTSISARELGGYDLSRSGELTWRGNAG